MSYQVENGPHTITSNVTDAADKVTTATVTVTVALAPAGDPGPAPPSANLGGW